MNKSYGWFLFLYLLYMTPLFNENTETIIIKVAGLWLAGYIGAMAFLKDCPLYQKGSQLPQFFKQYGLSILWVVVAPMVAIGIGIAPLNQKPLMEQVFVQGVLYAYVIGFFEEFLFRGLFQQTFRKSHDAITTVLVSALVFGLAHVPGMWQAPMAVLLIRVLWNMAFGLYLAILYEKTKHLNFVSIIHMLVDCSVILFFFSTETTYPMKTGAAILCIFYVAAAYGLSLMKEDNE